MKVLLVSSSSGSRGGGEKFLLGLAGGLRVLGHEVTLWASDHERMDELAAAFAPYGNVIRSPYRNTYDYRSRLLGTLWNGATVWRLAREWTVFAPDVIHVNKQNLEDGLDLLRAAQRSKIPSVCTIHLPQGERYFGARFGGLRDWLSARALRRYTGPLVTVLEPRARELREWVREAGRVSAIDNGVAAFDFSRRDAWREDVRRRFGWTEKHFVFCCIARMAEQKRPSLFLDLALEYGRTHPEARFLWVGDGVLTREWDERVSAADASGFIHRLPWQQDVRPFLAAADLYLHTAAFEGCPFSLLEALAARVPTAIPRDLLETLPVFASGEVAAIEPGRGLAGLDLSAAVLREQSGRGARLIEERFSLEAMASRYAAMYQDALLPRL